MKRRVVEVWERVARAAGRLARRRSFPGWLAFGAGVVVLVALAVHQMALVGDFRIDDAYITFSFSKNLAAGHGPVFSHGVRVEGYSNFLWMVICAAGYLLAPNADPYWWARAASLVFLVAALRAVYRLVRPEAGTLAGFLAMAALLVNTDVMRAALSGLETVPFMACIVLGWSAYLRATPPLHPKSLAWFLAAALMRIDGFVPLLIVLGFEFASALNDRRFKVLTYARWAAPALGVWAAYFAWRYSYYGLPLPSTYYAKSLVEQGEPGRGYHQLWGLAHDYALPALLPWVAIPVFRGPRRKAWALLLASVMQLAYAAQTGGDWMPFQRFALPVWPLISALLGWAAWGWWQELKSVQWLPRIAAGVALSGLLACSSVYMHAGHTDSPEEADKLGTAKHTITHTTHNLLENADLMRAVLRRPGERLVTDYAGVFSVYTDAAIIDQWGLCTAEIALRGGAQGINPIYGKSCAECYADLKPDYFHVMIPIVRDARAFANHEQVIRQVFQGEDIDRVIDLRRGFVTGRVTQASTGRVLWFLEKHRPELSYAPRSAGPGLEIDYPFLR